jgi:hypothetical protein
LQPYNLILTSFDICAYDKDPSALAPETKCRISLEVSPEYAGRKTVRIRAMEWLTHSQTGFQQAARYLLAMRLTIVASQLIAIAVAETMVSLAHRAEALILCLVYAVAARLCWVWFTRRPPRTAANVSLVLAADLLLIGGWLYLTGGYTNPLVSLLLLPIAVAVQRVTLWCHGQTRDTQNYRTLLAGLTPLQGP